MEPEQPSAVVQRNGHHCGPRLNVAALSHGTCAAAISKLLAFSSQQDNKPCKSLPETFLFLAFAVNAEDFTKRLSTIFGLNLADLEGTCAFGLVKDAGPLFVCPAGEITPVKGAYIGKVVIFLVITSSDMRLKFHLPRLANTLCWLCKSGSHSNYGGPTVLAAA